MLGYFLIGVLLGAGTGVPIGAVGVAVIDAAYRRPFRRAMGVGIGGAVGDILYSALGVMGLGALLARCPALPPVLYTITGVALIVYGVVQLRSRPAPVASSDALERARPRGRGGGETWMGFALGLGLVIANPASIVTWVVMVGGLMSNASRLEGGSVIIGVGIGSVAWFFGLALVARRGALALREKTVWICRSAGVLLIGYGLFSLGRGASYWI